MICLTSCDFSLGIIAEFEETLKEGDHLYDGNAGHFLWSFHSKSFEGYGGSMAPVAVLQAGKGGSASCGTPFWDIEIFRHLQTSSDIFRHLQTSSDIFRHLQTSNIIQLHLFFGRDLATAALSWQVGVKFFQLDLQPVEMPCSSY